MASVCFFLYWLVLSWHVLADGSVGVVVTLVIRLSIVMISCHPVRAKGAAKRTVEGQAPFTVSSTGDDGVMVWAVAAQ
jgi:hypothetical protein